MKVLRKGAKGPGVKAWQIFLRGQGYHIIADADFGKKTVSATKAFQKKKRLVADGVVGNATYAVAMLLGFEVIKDDESDIYSANWPPKPDFKPIVGTAARQRIFGKFNFKRMRVKGNPEAIRILDNWVEENIVYVKIPQLIGVKGTYRRKTFAFHKLVAEPVKDLFQAWDDEGLSDLILSWGGSFVPRFIRGSNTSLSNHSFGSAFDINVPWNYLGARPALVGKKGSVRKLVPIANELGFYWGGHFRRKDGMHFEFCG